MDRPHRGSGTRRSLARSLPGNGNPMSFRLHHRLEQDCVDLGSFDLCRLLLMDDSRYPWLILVPQRPEICEIYELSDSEQQSLTAESSYLSRSLSEEYKADKMNIAALGNMVSQLHIHHIVRYRTDPAWPGPVWGFGECVPYGAQELEQAVKRARGCLPRLDAGPVRY